MKTILKYILATSLILLVGCADNTNLDIQQLDQQAVALRTHLYDISGDQDFYENDKIDFTLLQNIKVAVKERGQSMIVAHRDDKIDDAILDEGLTKTISLLYLIWMEEVDAARHNLELDNLKLIQQEQVDFSSQKEVTKWLTDHNKKESWDHVQKYLNTLPELIEQGTQIDGNNDKLNVLKLDAEKFKTENNVGEYNRTADEYNTLMETNNQLIDKHNQQLEELDYESVYQDFINLIDVPYLFPGQETIKLAK